MWQLYVYSFVAGLFGVNGIPHFISGITGKKFKTPFGESSSAVTNVIWGWLNFVAAMLLLYWANVHQHLLRAFMMVGLGTLIMSIILANSRTKK
ncbi:MAG TPA: hypothetical protein VMV24_01360 [Candidatus Dormibacteraeota bacterium]|nr:hypothetical protein [Candidatus Dormibacteraeota bacterium]